MVQINLYNADKHEWETIEKDGKAVEFDDKQQADRFIEENYPEAYEENLYQLEEYKACEACGNLVSLKGFTCTCYECDTDYNGFGQRLAPREQWGYETGETAADILGVDTEDDTQ